MIVLSIGLQTPPETKDLAGRLGIDLTEGNFARPAPFEPVETNRPGIYVCGAFQGPKDIPQSVVDASAAAAAAGEILGAKAATPGPSSPTAVPEINVINERPAHRCLRLPLRHQHRRRGGRAGGSRLRRLPALRGIRVRQPLLLFPGHPGHHGPDHQAEKPEPGGGGGLHAENPRTACSRKP
jgi:hypothetical protein